MSTSRNIFMKSRYLKIILKVWPIYFYIFAQIVKRYFWDFKNIWKYKRNIWRCIKKAQINWNGSHCITVVSSWTSVFCFSPAPYNIDKP